MREITAKAAYSVVSSTACVPKVGADFNVCATFRAWAANQPFLTKEGNQPGPT